WSFRHDRADGSRGRVYRRATRSHLPGREAAWSFVGDYRGPRQRGNAHRSRERRPPHRAYHQSRAFYSGHGPRQKDRRERRRIAAGYFSDDAFVDEFGTAETDDGRGSADDVHRVRESRKAYLTRAV